MNIINRTIEINEMINNASSIFLMAHKDLDLDAINSCFGMSYYVKKHNKKSYIIVDDKKPESAVRKVMSTIKNKCTIINSRQIKSLKDDKSLLIVLDTNKTLLVQNPEVLGQFDKIMNIDHHDVTADKIKADLSIIDEESSSTCEMITLLCKENDVKISSYLGMLLLAGIILDTNHYQVKTKADTFYISYYLMTCGAQISDVNNLLKQNLKDYVKRQKVITSVQVVNGVAIGRGMQRSIYMREEIAKMADSLLTFDKIRASFVIAKSENDTIRISARSNGEINVGKILEKFGGGGGEYEAAAHFEDANIKQIIEDLKKIIKSL